MAPGRACVTTPSCSRLVILILRPLERPRVVPLARFFEVVNGVVCRAALVPHEVLGAVGLAVDRDVEIFDSSMASVAVEPTSSESSLLSPSSSSPIARRRNMAPELSTPLYFALLSSFLPSSTSFKSSINVTIFCSSTSRTSYSSTVPDLRID
jgi:hypothetical protein